MKPTKQDEERINQAASDRFYDERLQRCFIEGANHEYNVQTLKESGIIIQMGQEIKSLKEHIKILTELQGLTEQKNERLICEMIDGGLLR